MRCAVGTRPRIKVTLCLSTGNSPGIGSHLGSTGRPAERNGTILDPTEYHNEISANALNCAGEICSETTDEPPLACEVICNLLINVELGSTTQSTHLYSAQKRRHLTLVRLGLLSLGVG